MEFLRVGSEPRPRVVRDQLGDLRRDHRPDVFRGRCPPGRGRALRREKAECAEGFRPPLALRGSRLEQHALERGERVRATGEGFDLELDKAFAHAPAVEHRHRVDGHVCHCTPVLTCADPLAVRPEDSDGLERAPAKNAGQQRCELGGRHSRPSGDLELESLALAWELELPEAPSVLDAAPQRDPGARERPVGRVVVGGGEDLGPERPAWKLRQREPGRNRELQLAFMGLLEPGHGRIVAPSGSRDLHVAAP